MDIKDFIDLVAKMRVKQRRYYKEQKPSILIEAKELEKQVDHALKEGIGERPHPAAQDHQIGLFE